MTKQAQFQAQVHAANFDHYCRINRVFHRRHDFFSLSPTSAKHEPKHLIFYTLNALFLAAAANQLQKIPGHTPLFLTIGACYNVFHMVMVTITIAGLPNAAADAFTLPNPTNWLTIAKKVTQPCPTLNPTNSNTLSYTYDPLSRITKLTTSTNRESLTTLLCKQMEQLQGNIMLTIRETETNECSSRDPVTPFEHERHMRKTQQLMHSVLISTQQQLTPPVIHLICKLIACQARFQISRKRPEVIFVRNIANITALRLQAIFAACQPAQRLLQTECRKQVTKSWQAPQFCFLVTRRPSVVTASSATTAASSTTASTATASAAANQCSTTTTATSAATC